MTMRLPRPPGAGRAPDARRWIRGLAAIAAGVVVWASGAVGAAPAATAAAPPAATTPAITLVGQSTTVGPGGSFNVVVHLSSAITSADHIDLGIAPYLTSRAAFDEAAAGHVAQAIYLQPDQLATARHLGGGNVVVSLPITPRTGEGKQLPAFDPYTESPEVFPITLQAVSPASVTIGTPLTTFLVYSPAKTGFSKLGVSLTVPINAAPNVTSALTTGPVPASTAQGLAGTVAALSANSRVPVTLAVTPQTVAALASGTAADKATVASLRRLVHDGDELISSPYVSTSIPGLDNSDLDNQVSAQLAQGTQTLKTDLGEAPQTSTWVEEEPYDVTALQLLIQHGLKDLVLPDNDLSALPTADQTYPYEKPYFLQSESSSDQVEVVGADAILSGRLVASSDPVLAAEQILAELAMIKLQYPSLAAIQSVAILPGPGQTIQPALVAALAAGLKNNPLLQGVTATGMFQMAGKLAAPAATSTASTTTTTQPTSATTGADGATAATPVRSLAGKAAPDVPGAALISTASEAVSGLSSMIPTDASELGRLNQQVLVAQSNQISGTDRRALLRSVSRTVSRFEGQVKLVGASSVTLTARNVHLPLTIQGVDKTAVHVELTLTSNKLLFKPYKPADGSCAQYQTQEVCQLVLSSTQTLLKVPVEARTTGVFTLGLSLDTPSGAQLDSATATIRSTAVSAVGWVLIFGACLFLAIWWIRDIRSGRRARHLVPRPEEVEEEPVPTPTVAGPADRTTQTPIHRSGAGSVSPSRQAGGRRDGSGNRRNPEEIPT
jgi:hypothetical protein